MNNQVRALIDALLPWDEIRSVEITFRSLFVTFIIFALLVSWWVMSNPLPKKDRKEAEKIPDRLAQLVLEKKEEPPPPPPPEPEKEPEPEEEPKPEEPKPEDKKEEAKKVAEEKIKDVKDALEGLRDLGPLVANQNLTMSGAQETQISRNLLTSRAGKGSGGIAISNVSSGGGGSGDLSGVQLAAVASEIPQEASIRPTDADGVGRRTTEEIRRSIDRHVGALNAIYRRALREDPSLQGSLVIRLVIEPNGTISHAEIVSSDLKNDDLNRKLLVRFKQITFEAAKVKVWDDKYTLNFFPS